MRPSFKQCQLTPAFLKLQRAVSKGGDPAFALTAVGLWDASAPDPVLGCGRPDASGKRGSPRVPSLPPVWTAKRGWQKGTLWQGPPLPLSEGGQTRVVNGLTASALTAPGVEARRGWQKGTLRRDPFLPPLSGGQTQVVNGLTIETFTAPAFRALIAALPPDPVFKKRETLPLGSRNARPTAKHCKNRHFGRFWPEALDPPPTPGRKRARGLIRRSAERPRLGRPAGIPFPGFPASPRVPSLPPVWRPDGGGKRALSDRDLHCPSVKEARRGW